MNAVQRPILVVPCFNEASRLDADEIRRLAGTADVWLIDDGSTDRTRERTAEIAAASGERVSAFANGRNLGKAETVRRHLLEACDRGTTIVGFLDADLATPVDEMLAVLGLLESSSADAVTGARVGLSGRQIRRSGARHYFGRIFSTFASLAIGSPYYDTQCGAKAFRNTPSLRAAIAEPFLSRWAFDVELLGRLLAGSPDAPAVPSARLVEYPLHAWRDVAGSKLSFVASLKTVLELVSIGRDLGRRRQRAAASRPKA